MADLKDISGDSSKEELLKLLKSFKKENQDLEKQVAKLSQQFSTAEEKIRQAEKDKDVIESGAMDLVGIIADINEEKKEVEAAMEKLEASAMDLARSFGEMNLEKMRAQETERLASRNLAKIIGELNQQRMRAEQDREHLESTAMGLIYSFGQMHEEKLKAEQDVNVTSKQMAKLLGEVNIEKEKAEQERDMLESNSMNLIKAFGEINEEKKKVEESAMGMAKTVGEVTLEKKKAEEDTVRVMKNLAKTIGSLYLEKDKADQDKNILEKTSMDLINAFSEINLEKSKVEETAMELAKALGEVNLEKVQAQSEKSTLEQTSMDLVQSFGEINAEKAKVEETAMDLARMVGDINQEKTVIEEQRRKYKELNNRLIATEESLKSLMNKIIPEEISEQFLKGQVEFTEHSISIVFIDIASFTEYASGKESIQVARDVKEFFTELHKIIIYYNGWLVKYVGDEIMAMFGVPFKTRTHALDAVLCARHILEHSRRSDFDVRIGINTGNATIGDVGSPWRPQYDCMGGSVNLASRLLGLCKYLETDVLISEETNDLIKYFFANESYPNTIIRGVGKKTVYSLGDLHSVIDNPFRVRPGSVLADKYSGLFHEIREKRDRYFSNIDVTKIELKDGSVGSGDAVAFYALALVDHAGLKVDRDKLIRAGYMLNSGKLFIKRTLLTKSRLTQKEMKFMKRMYEFTIRVLKKIGGHEDILPIIEQVSQEYSEIKSNEAKILKIASAYEGILSPKLYKVSRVSFEQAAEALKKAIPDKLTDKFLEIV